MSRQKRQPQWGSETEEEVPCEIPPKLGCAADVRPFFSWLVAGVIVVFAASGAFAREPTGLANVTILATGGTIAGTGATSTTTVGYTAATAGVSA